MKLIHAQDVPVTRVHGTTDRRALITTGEMKSSLQTFNDAWLKPGESFEPHKHDDCEEIFYVLEGTGNLIMDKDIYPLTGGDVVIVEPGEMHTIQNTGTGQFRWLAIRVKI